MNAGLCTGTALGLSRTWEGHVLSTAVEQLPVAVMVTDAAGVIEYANPASSRLTGYSSGELLGRHTRLLKSGVHDAAFYRGLWDTIRGGEVWRGRLRNRRKDGSLYWESATICPVRHGDGGIRQFIAIKEDITEAVNTVRLLDEARGDMQALARQSRTMHWLVDASGLYVEVSPVSSLVLGYAPSDLEGRMHCGDLHADRGRGLFREELLRLIRRGEAVENVVRALEHKDGGVVWVITNAVPVRGADGVLQGYRGTDTDITRRKTAEDAVRETAAQLQGFFDVSLDLLCIADRSGRFLRLNREWATVLRYPPEELVGTMSLDLVHPDDQAATRRAMAQLASGRPVLDFVNRYRCRCGGWRHLEWRSHPHGELVYAAARDVTERIELERNLRDDEAAYRQLFDSNPLPVWVLDCDSLAIRSVNQAAVEHYGFSREEFETKRLLDLHEPQDRERLKQAVVQACDGAPRMGEWTHRRRDGSMMRVDLVAHGLTHRGRAARLVLANDVTERRELERQFLRAQRTECIGTLASGIAHDLNNILTPILVSIDLLDACVCDPAGREMLATVATSAKRGAEMVRRVLSFARGGEGDREPVQVELLIRDMESIIAATFPKNLRFVARVAQGLWPVAGVPAQLHQVLLNLCVNARDAMPDGGTLTVSAHNVVLDDASVTPASGARPGRHVCVTVEDTGPGIPRGAEDKIFDPFFTTKPPGAGTGLGLFTTLGIVRAHRGFIRVGNLPGRGARFGVMLPAGETSAGDAASGSGPARTACDGQGRLVLLADDERAVREMSSRLLRAHGYRVVTAADGSEALALFARHRGEVALVVVDMMMPVLDGAHVIRVLRRLAPGVPVVAASGVATPEHAARATALGAHRFLAKPHSGGTLLAVLAEVLGAGATGGSPAF